MKKLFYSMSIVALVLASCGDASGEASSEQKSEDTEKASNDNGSNEASSMYCDCMGAAMDVMTKMFKQEITEDEAQDQMSDCDEYMSSLSEEDMVKEQANCPELTMEKIQAKVQESVLESMQME
jgi:hypothetical protein